MFLMRCLFTMFAEDVGLLPEKSFKEVLEECEKNPEAFTPRCRPTLGSDGRSATWAHVAPKTKVQASTASSSGATRRCRSAARRSANCAQAASYDWREVDPSIFGTLLEQALDPEERKRLGAHYTPRAYVERLVVATIIEPLREDWRNVQATAETKRAAGDLKGAAAEVQAFHDKLCETRVLDPACGTGNFLYVSLELMKRLEGEVLEALLDLGGQEALRGLGRTASIRISSSGWRSIRARRRLPNWCCGSAICNGTSAPRARPPEEPILRAFKNIEVKNAVLTWDGYPVPKIVDGKETYPNARRPEWPTAEFIVGNPPFIGGKDFCARVLATLTRSAVGRASHMNESADFVMYWWDRAAELLTRKGTVLRRFGLVTTNSITQVFQRRVMERHLKAKKPDLARHGDSRPSLDKGHARRGRRSYRHDGRRSWYRQKGTLREVAEGIRP